MENPIDGKPSEIVYSTARTIADDMKEMISDACEDMDNYDHILKNMIAALEDTKRNLEKHSIPMSEERSSERRTLKKKISEIRNAIAVARKLESLMSLTIEDICQVMRPYGLDKSTIKFFKQILNEPTDPTDKELRDIEDDQEDE